MMGQVGSRGIGVRYPGGVVPPRHREPFTGAPSPLTLGRAPHYSYCSKQYRLAGLLQKTSPPALHPLLVSRRPPVVPTDSLFPTVQLLHVLGLALPSLSVPVQTPRTISSAPNTTPASVWAIGVACVPSVR